VDLMKKVIVEIKPCKLRHRVDLILDDGICLNVDKRIIDATGIYVLQEIDLDYLDKEIKADEYKRGLEAALNYLEYRPRSEFELNEYLRLKHKLSVESSFRVVTKLKEMSLINDKVFAEEWIRNRISYKPKSRLMITRELLQKGIDYDLAREIANGVNDEESAYKAGVKKAKLLKSAGYSEFSKRMGAYLARRGFGSDTIRSTVSKLWEHMCDNNE
jgi:regulatory protein